MQPRNESTGDPASSGSLARAEEHCLVSRALIVPVSVVANIRAG